MFILFFFLYYSVGVLIDFSIVDSPWQSRYWKTSPIIFRLESPGYIDLDEYFACEASVSIMEWSEWSYETLFFCYRFTKIFFLRIMHLTKPERWVYRNVSIIKEQKTEAKLSKENLKFLHGGKSWIWGGGSWM